MDEEPAKALSMFWKRNREVPASRAWNRLDGDRPRLSEGELHLCRWRAT